MFLILSILLLVNVYFVIPAQTGVSLYTFTYYQFNYNHGFISRGLIGTIFNFIFSRVTFNVVYITTLILITSLTIFVAFLIKILIKKYDNNITITFISMLLIYSPSTFMQMFSNDEFGRFDYFLFFNAIISLIFICKKKYLFLIPILSIVSIFIHQNYIIIFVPLICSILLYDYITKKDKKFLVCLIFNVISSLIAITLVYTIGKHPNFENSHQYAFAIQEQTDYPIDEEPIVLEFYSSLKHHVDDLKEMVFPDNTCVSLVYGISTYLFYVILLWNICLKFIYKETKYKKIFILVMLSTLSSLVLFLVARDYGRWFTSIISSSSMLTIYLLFENKNLITNHIKSIEQNQHVILFSTLFFIFMFQTGQFYELTFDKINILNDKILTIINFYRS